jgi:hypothetical protein
MMMEVYQTQAQSAIESAKSKGDGFLSGKPPTQTVKIVRMKTCEAKQVKKNVPMFLIQIATLWKIKVDYAKKKLSKTESSKKKSLSYMIYSRITLDSHASQMSCHRWGSNLDEHSCGIDLQILKSETVGEYDCW